MSITTEPTAKWEKNEALINAAAERLAGAVIEKLAYNQQRADHKPENRYAEGGKVF